MYLMAHGLASESGRGGVCGYLGETSQPFGGKGIKSLPKIKSANLDLDPSGI